MDFDQFLFAMDGFQGQWLVADRLQVLGNYSNESRTIVTSSKSASSHAAKWYRRAAK
jgi:hypothetical protein